MAKISAVLLGLLAAAVAASASAVTSCGHTSCPENFVLLSGRCLNVTTDTYRGSGKPLPWAEARERCRAMAAGEWAADLASVDLPLLAAFTDFIRKHIPGMSTYVFWAGARKVDGEWQALDGTPIDPRGYLWHMHHPSSAAAAPDHHIYGMLVPASLHQLRFYLTPYAVSSVGPSALCEARRRA